MKSVPVATLGSSGKKIPVLGFGTATYPFTEAKALKESILHAIKVGYRHFDTAALYQSEEPLGEAIAEALRLGLIKSREELFVTSKLWCSDGHPDLVLPALQQSLKNLGLEYLDLYLIHWPVSAKPDCHEVPIKKENFLLMDVKLVWEAMEVCQERGLTRSIGVSNFSCRKLEKLLEMAKIPPSMNQVEMNPMWQQQKLRKFCEEKGILVSVYSPLGAIGTSWGSDRVLECQVLKDIAHSKGKTVAQVALRWAHEQGVIVIVKSSNKKRMEENLDIFDWKLSHEELEKISQLPQIKGVQGDEYISSLGPFKTLEELWDGEI